MLSQNTSSAIGALVEKGVACCLRDQEKHEEALLHFDAARRFYELLEASKKDRIPGEAREILQYLNKRVEDDFKEQRERVSSVHFGGVQSELVYFLARRLVFIFRLEESHTTVE